MTGRVESASQSNDDPREGVIVLEGDIQVRVTSETTIDADGDLVSLEEALAAIEDGTAVRSRSKERWKTASSPPRAFASRPMTRAWFLASSRLSTSVRALSCSRTDGFSGSRTMG